MDKRKRLVFCFALASVCWGILTYAGIYDGNTTRTILYGVCFVLSMINMIRHIVAIKKEKSDGQEEKTAVE